MRRFLATTCAVAFALTTLCATSTGAWGPVGHQVIALIAWDTLTEPTRLKAVELMQQAPPEAGLASLFPKDSGPMPDRQHDFFRIAATWPDLARSAKRARHAFHRPTWHFRDFFWKRQAGRVVDLPDMNVPAENALERLQFFKGLLSDASKSAPDRAIGAAWVLHIVGDVHQPLHCSARVTTQEPQGDAGGNTFKLDAANEDLHHYWDTMIDKPVPKQSNETNRAYLLRAASAISAEHPKASVEGELKPGKTITPWEKSPP